MTEEQIKGLQKALRGLSKQNNALLTLFNEINKSEGSDKIDQAASDFMQGTMDYHDGDRILGQAAWAAKLSEEAAKERGEG